MAVLSQPLSISLSLLSPRVRFPPRRPALFPNIRTHSALLLVRSAEPGNAGSFAAAATAAVEDKVESKGEAASSAAPPVAAEKKPGEEEATKGSSSLGSNGAPVKAELPAFKDPRWVGGTWDLNRFKKDGVTDWDSVIDAEVRRRKWLEDNPEASSNEEPVIFDTSVIPWWPWVKRFHLPEAELLNGRAAMIGFFMAYFVDSITGIGLVDQTSNFFCKTLLFIAVAGVLLIRKNDDAKTLKKLLEETTFYDKQWQATWQDDNIPSDSN